MPQVKCLGIIHKINSSVRMEKTAQKTNIQVKSRQTLIYFVQHINSPKQNYVIANTVMEMNTHFEGLYLVFLLTSCYCPFRLLLEKSISTVTGFCFNGSWPIRFHCECVWILAHRTSRAAGGRRRGGDNNTHFFYNIST